LPRWKPLSHQQAGERHVKTGFLIELLGLKLGLALIDRLPLASTLALAKGISDITYLADRGRRKTAQSNIRRAGLAGSPDAVRRIARESFRHFACMAVETIRYDRVPELTQDPRIILQVDPRTMAVVREPGRGVILASGHIGNWEIAARLLSEIKPVVGMARGMKNPHTDKLLRTRKASSAMQYMPKHDADMMRLFTTLREGKILALLADQHAHIRGMMVNFLGTPASTHTSPALLHLVTRAPLCFGWCRRDGPMAYTLFAHEPIEFRSTGRREDDVRAVLEELTAALESAIRMAPEQYLWAHRRWRAAAAVPA
jgi:KDO2-lipid IV(A) lauroyltransferase